ncbi:MAG TPA: 2-hydroxychromene-2-carboxylate isomerase [Candidatus Binataceae bacterium]|nr:2-hydroxychromene-2-carboxylate isomerase [Candidatus Binataceae bacterium]
MTQIHFYFDFFSPFSYLASLRIGDLAARHGATVVYHVVDNQVIKRNAGTTGRPNHALPPKYRYLRADLARWARRYGVPLVSPESVSHMDPTIPPRIGRGFLVARRRQKELAYLSAAYRKVWGEAAEMNDALLRELAAVAGLPAADFLKAVDSDEIRKEAEREIAEASERGVFGVPSVIVNDELFWGNDRLDMVEDLLRDASKGARA